MLSSLTSGPFIGHLLRTYLYPHLSWVYGAALFLTCSLGREVPSLCPLVSHVNLDVSFPMSKSPGIIFGGSLII